MGQSWDDVFKKQSKEAANIELCWIESRLEETITYQKPKLVMCGGGGNGFAMPMTFTKK